MTLTAVFVPAAEGGFTALVEEIPGAISEGETIEQARENLADALRLVLACNRELTRQQEPAESQRKTTSVPRHREIKNFTARAICRQLEVPDAGA